MGRFGVPELVLILVILLFLFGAAKLPQIARSLGESLKEFKKSAGRSGRQKSRRFVREE